MAQTINIQRLWDQKYRDESVPFPIDGTTSTAGVFNVLDYGAVGSGDDTAALQAAITAAQAVAGTVTSPAGKTYSIKSPLQITATISIDFSNSTIKRLPAWADAEGGFGGLVEVKAANVQLSNMTLDGNRANAATGGGLIADTGGVGTICRNVRVVRNFRFGWEIVHSSTVDAYNCVGSDNFAGDDTADGFVVASSALLRTYNCTADLNERTGFNFITGAADGCRLDGSASGNGTGASISSSYGYAPSFKANSNNLFGIIVGEPATDWHFGIVETSDIGNAVGNGAGTGFETFGAARIQIDSLVADKNPSYGLALGGSTHSSSYISVGRLHCDRTGSFDTDPGLVMSSAIHCSIGYYYCRGHSFAVSAGEAGTALPNAHNSIAFLHAEDINFALISASFGDHFHIGKIVARNCYCSDVRFGRGLVTLWGGESLTNWTIGWIENYNDAGIPITTPMAWFAQDTLVSNNQILDGYESGVDLESVSPNGLNRVTLRKPCVTVTQIATAESGESWSTTTNNTTAGQFIKGSQSKKITQVDGNFAEADLTFAAVDLSAMPTGDYFRMWIYVHNYVGSAFGNGLGTNDVQLRFNDSGGGGYFAYGWTTDRMQAGGQYLYGRKSDFAAAAGAPNWNHITGLSVLVFSPTGSGTTISFDDIARIDTDLTSLVTGDVRAPITGAHTAGERIFNTTPVASGNIGWVCVAGGTPGTWKTFGVIGA